MGSLWNSYSHNRTVMGKQWNVYEITMELHGVILEQLRGPYELLWGHNETVMGLQGNFYGVTMELFCHHEETLVGSPWTSVGS